MPIVYFLLYILGSYLSLMRCYGSAWDNKEPHEKILVFLSILFSWGSLLLWIVIYFDSSEDFFFKTKDYKE